MTDLLLTQHRLQKKQVFIESCLAILATANLEDSVNLYKNPDFQLLIEDKTELYHHLLRLLEAEHYKLFPSSLLHFIYNKEENILLVSFLEEILFEIEIQTSLSLSFSNKSINPIYAPIRTKTTLPLPLNQGAIIYQLTVLKQEYEDLKALFMYYFDEYFIDFKKTIDSQLKNSRLEKSMQNSNDLLWSNKNLDEIKAKNFNLTMFFDITSTFTQAYRQYLLKNTVSFNTCGDFFEDINQLKKDIAKLNSLKINNENYALLKKEIQIISHYFNDSAYFQMVQEKRYQLLIYKEDNYHSSKHIYTLIDEENMCPFLLSHFSINDFRLIVNEDEIKFLPSIERNLEVVTDFSIEFDQKKKVYHCLHKETKESVEVNMKNYTISSHANLIARYDFLSCFSSQKERKENNE